MSSTTATLIQRNDDEKSVKMFLRGRPIILNVPQKYAPTYDIVKVQPAPSKQLKLDWAYGYRGKDCRSNLYELPTGEMVYFIAATVVMFNMDEQSQRHYLGHTDDIKSLAIHPNQLLIATGQCGGHDKTTASPHIRVWDSVTLKTMAVIGSGEFTGAVNCLSFSRADGGALLCAIDDAPDKIISVWEWQRGESGHKLTDTKCSGDTIVAAEFHPLDQNQIVTAGKNHIAFWTLDQSKKLSKRMGIFEGRDKPKYITCVTFTQTGDVVTGDSNGCIIVWGRGSNTIQKLIKKVHEGGLFTICALLDGGFVSGGKDGRLVLLQDDLKVTSVVQSLEPNFGAARFVSQGKGSQMLIGTLKNCILTGDMEQGFAPVVTGHTDELWGLATHPKMPQFVTGGFDRLLQLWDSLSHSVVWSKDIGESVQCCAFSPEGDVIVVGAKNGKWFVFDTITNELLAEHVDGSEVIQTVKFSPDGTLLAIGSRDNYVYVYRPSEDFRKFTKIGKCSGHSSFILHVDFSVDGSILRSNSGDYEVLYWNMSDCRQVTNPSETTDTEWATQSCVLSFETIGIWPESADGTDINTVAKSNDSEVLATGDDFGKVNLYSYPAMQPITLSHVYGGHSSHVTNVSFLHDNTRLISTGGNDTSVLQWSIS